MQTVHEFGGRADQCVALCVDADEVPGWGAKQFLDLKRKDLLIMLLLLQEIAHRPWLMPRGQPEILSFKRGQDLVNIVDTYVETVFTELDHVLGWRVYFVARPADFSWDRAMAALVAENATREARGVKTTNRLEKLFRGITSRGEYMHAALRKYYMSQDGKSMDAAAIAQVTALKPGEDGIKLADIFSYEKALAHFKEGSKAVASYDEEGYMTLRWDAESIAVGWVTNPIRNPLCMVHALLYPMAGEGETLQQEMDRCRQAGLGRLAHARTEDPEAVIKHTAEMVAKELAAARYSHPELDEIGVRNNPILFAYGKSFMEHSASGPGVKAADEYLRKELRARPSIMHDSTSKMSSSLSEYGNFIAMLLFMLDEAMGVNMAHVETMHSWLAGFGQFDLRSKRARVHILDLGPPATSKSHIQSVVINLSAPGTFTQIDNMSEKAFTANMNWDGMRVFIDEGGENFLASGRDGSGRALQKSLLSKNRIRTMHTAFGDNGERKSVLTETYMLAMFSIAANLKLSQIAPPMASRMLVRTLHVHRRDDVHIVTSEMIANSEGKRKLARDSFVRRCRLMHALSARLWVMMAVGHIPQVNINHALDLYHEITEVLVRENHVTVDPRRAGLFTGLVLGCTVAHALNQVFCTTKHLRADEPFKEEHLLLCVQYLYADAEIAYHALMQMSDVLVNPVVPCVCSAIKSMDVLFAPMRNYQSFDYNYLLIKTLSDKVIIHQAARKIAEHVPVRFTVNSIVDMLCSLQDRYLEVVSYETGSIRKPGGGREKRAIVELYSDAATHTHGLKILRDYVDSGVNQDTRAVVLRAIKATAIKHSDPAVNFVTGESFRDVDYAHPDLDPVALANRKFPQFTQVFTPCRDDEPTGRGVVNMEYVHPLASSSSSSSSRDEEDGKRQKMDDQPMVKQESHQDKHMQLYGTPCAPDTRIVHFASYPHDAIVRSLKNRRIAYQRKRDAAAAVVFGVVENET